MSCRDEKEGYIKLGRAIYQKYKELSAINPTILEGNHIKSGAEAHIDACKGKTIKELIGGINART